MLWIQEHLRPFSFLLGITDMHYLCVLTPLVPAAITNTLLCVYRSAVHGAAHQQSWSDRSDNDGRSLGIWSCQCPVHLHDLLSPVLLLW